MLKKLGETGFTTRGYTLHEGLYGYVDPAVPANDCCTTAMIATGAASYTVLP